MEDRQLDIAAEAREIEKALAKLAKATDLAKERMAAAAKQAEEAAEAIGGGATDKANAATDKAKDAVSGARDQFRELAGQVRALLAPEQAERVSAAQQMAAELARQQQQLADQLAMGAGQQQRDPSSQMPMPGAGKQPSKDDMSSKGLGGLARNAAEKAKTLVDVLGAASKPESPADQKSADEVARIMKAADVQGVAARLSQLPGQIENRKLQDARTTAGDGAERLEMAAEQLAMLHRTIVAPKVQELISISSSISWTPISASRAGTLRPTN
jgi:hypothetical protein